MVWWSGLVVWWSGGLVVWWSGGLGWWFEVPPGAKSMSGVWWSVQGNYIVKR